MSEYALNEYSWQMNLTVNSLEKKDFGEYVCSSVNALGKADGIVRLQGKYRFKNSNDQYCKCFFVYSYLIFDLI